MLSCVAAKSGTALGSWACVCLPVAAHHGSQAPNFPPPLCRPPLQLYGLLEDHVGRPEFAEQLAAQRRARQAAIVPLPPPASPDTGRSGAGGGGGGGGEVLQRDWWELRPDGNVTAVVPEATGDYIVVEKEDVVDALSQFIAAYLATLPEAQNLEPRQLQCAITTTLKVRPGVGRGMGQGGRGLGRDGAGAAARRACVPTLAWLPQALVPAQPFLGPPPSLKLLSPPFPFGTGAEEGEGAAAGGLGARAVPRGGGGLRCFLRLLQPLGGQGPGGGPLDVCAHAGAAGILSTAAAWLQRAAPAHAGRMERARWGARQLHIAGNTSQRLYLPSLSTCTRTLFLL